LATLAMVDREQPVAACIVDHDCIAASIFSIAVQGAKQEKLRQSPQAALLGATAART
jgi:hypothetical protein